MNFTRHLLGGVAIMVVATLVGIAQNAARSNPMKLIPRVPATTAVTPQSELETAPMESAAGDPAAAITATEIASGELVMERVHALANRGDIIVVDARSEHEYEEGHIPGSINIPYEKYVEYYDKLMDYVPMDANVVTYCRSVTCDLSDDLAQELRLAGYPSVMTYRGGWEEWTEAGLPAETGAK